jgi:CheY-like chemotaxis protein
MKIKPVLYLIDDDEDDRMFLSGAIGEVIEELTIIECSSGVDFLEVAVRGIPVMESVLIVMDMNMPKMTGIETISELKANPNLAKLPIVVISTSANPELQEQAYAAGAADYLIKPSSAAGLTEIANIIKGHFGTLS